MDDVNFIDYFHDLSGHDLNVKKQAAYKIVETLAAAEALGSQKDYTQYDERIQKMLQKYMNGDMGTGVSPDLSYTLKK